jgi:DNA-binding MarR family transcriptional regulator
MDEPHEVGAADYQALAEFRYQIRQFIRFSELAAKSAGLEPRQHQLLLALKGLPTGKDATITYVADRLQVRHHSAVGLVDRLAQRGLVERERNDDDRRQVLVHLTAHGEEMLRELSAHHVAELRATAPGLVQSLEALTAGARSFWASDPEPGRR